jgi:hypothetical protein
MPPLLWAWPDTVEVVVGAPMALGRSAGAVVVDSACWLVLQLPSKASAARATGAAARVREKSMGERKKGEQTKVNSEYASK